MKYTCFMGIRGQLYYSKIIYNKLYCQFFIKTKIVYLIIFKRKVQINTIVEIES